MNSIRKLIPHKGLARAFPSKAGRRIGPIGFALIAAASVVILLSEAPRIDAYAHLLLVLGLAGMIFSIQKRGENGAKSMFAI